MSSWYDIYKKEIENKGTILDYVDDKVKYKKKFTDLIEKYSPRKKIVEAGCGTGVVSTYMASLEYSTTAVDIDKDILNLAKEISKKYNAKKETVFSEMSILDLKFKDKEFDVSFSNGVVEHFNDQEIITILKEQMRIASTVVVGIPTRYFDQSEAMYGDERYLKFKYWRKLINQAGGKIIEEKSYHFAGIKEQIVEVKKYFRPKPFKIFVIVAKESQDN